MFGFGSISQQQWKELLEDAEDLSNYLEKISLPVTESLLQEKSKESSLPASSTNTKLDECERCGDSTIVEKKKGAWICSPCIEECSF